MENISLAVNEGAAVISEAMLTPLVDGITANIGVILPIGVGLLAVFIGIGLIPKLIKKFTGVGGSN